jgi:hypothetical protein
MAGFKFAYRLSGGAPTIVTIKYKDTETLSFGDIVNLESGEADLGATGDTTLAGLVVSATAAGTDSTTDAQVIIDPDAVYSVTDANARLLGATLDIAGTTGAMSVASSSNKEFVVMAPSSAAQETLVGFNVGKHFLNKAL